MDVAETWGSWRCRVSIQNLFQDYLQDPNPKPWIQALKASYCWELGRYFGIYPDPWGPPKNRSAFGFYTIGTLESRIGGPTFRILPRLGYQPPRRTKQGFISWVLWSLLGSSFGCGCMLGVVLGSTWRFRVLMAGFSLFFSANHNLS